jgi:hypothetical protein
VTISLIVPLANLGFAPHDVHVMTDEAKNARDLPTEENIVRRPCEMSLLPLDFVQLREMRKLVDGAQPGDSFFFYCT